MTDFDAQEAILQDRRKRYAQQLSDSQAPQGGMAGNTFVAPHALEYLAAGLRGFGALKGQSMAEKELGQLQGQRGEARKSAMDNFLRQAQGTPAFELPADQAGPVQPAQAPDMGKAYAALMQAPDQQLQQAGMQGMIRMPEIKAAAEERASAMDFKKQEADAARSARIEQMKQDHAFRMERMEADKASDAQKQKADQDFKREMLKITAGNRPAPQAQTLQTENGVLERVNGKWQPITIDGKPVMSRGTGSNAVLPEVAKIKDATDAMALLQQAAPLVRGATGSGIGAGVDWLAGQVGKATSGAENIAQLKTIAGMLVSKMPKMTGPQSDKDVLLYKEMAGNIGDPSVPNALKEKAMQTIMEIQARYANTQAPALDFSGAPQKQISPQDSQAMEWARANPSDPRSKAIMQRLGGQ